MFVARLLAALKMPLTHLGVLDDTLVLDVDLYRAALLCLLQKLGDQGALDEPTACWIFDCIADGWVDEHLANVRDGLLELGAVQDQAHLNRLLMAATHHILGCGPGTPAHGLLGAAADGVLSAADTLLLQTVTQALQGPGSDQEPLGLRLLARRYALELGLLARAASGEATGAAALPHIARTRLGEAVLALPQKSVLTFLLALETLQSGGPADRWRTPRSALGPMSAQPQFLVATTAQARRTVDAAGLFPWRRIRRLHLLGICEPVRLQDERGEPLPEDATRAAYPYRLSAAGAAAIAGVLAEPRSDLVELAELLLHERAQAAVAPLLRRAPALAAAAPTPVMPAPPLAELAPGISPASPRPAEGVAELPVRVPTPPRSDNWSGELPWRVAGPLSTLPATAATLADPLFSDSLLASGVESRPFPLAAPGSGAESSRQELDIGSLIERAWAELHITGVHFALLGPTVRTVGERRALLQAWRELLRCAADAALQGVHSPPLVTVELDPSPEAVEILIHDSGPPLAPIAPSELTDAGTPRPEREALLALAEPTQLHALPGARRGMWLAQHTLTGQGAQLTLAAPQLGGTTVRVTLPRSPRPVRSAA